MSDYRVQNILDAYAQASDSDLLAGRYWYATARDFSIGLADRFGVSPDVAAAVVAVLSPRVSWTLNQAMAEAFLADGYAPGFDRSNAKCSAIALGGIFAGYAHAFRLYPSALNGPKVQRFFLTIVSDGAHDVVVIDRHAIDIAEGRRHANANASLDTERQYRPWELAYLEAARILDIPAHVLQATTWVSWRRRHGIVDSYTEMEQF